MNDDPIVTLEVQMSTLAAVRKALRHAESPGSTPTEAPTADELEKVQGFLDGVDQVIARAGRAPEGRD